jgi:hypothetical protein
MARRAPSRHGRSISRFTPRRWLPFLVLTAVVAAGVAVASRDTGAPSATRAPASTTALVPAVAERGALSTAYFCGGGTARGPKGPAEMTIVIANDDRLGAQADITVYDDAGHHAMRTVRVPADGRARVPAASIRAGAWVAATVEVRGGRAVVEREVRGPDAFDASPCSATASDVWYVPSGTTRRGSEEYLSVFNPFPDSSSVDISFATESGNRAPRSLQGVSVPGGSLRIVPVSDTITNREVIAATVRTRSGRVVVDRVQTHDGNGDPVKGTGNDPSTTPPPVGLVSTSGVAGAARRWVFPGTSLAPGNRSRVVVFNPGPAQAEVDVVPTYQDWKDNDPAEPVQLTIRPGDVSVVDLTDDTDLHAGIGFSLVVESLRGQPVVAERVSDSGRPLRRVGSAVVVGSPLAASRWLVAQGGPSRTRTSSVTVTNAGPRAVHVRVVQLTAGTRRPLPGATDLRIGAYDRLNLSLDQAAPSATFEVQADGPIVVAYGLNDVDRVGLALLPAEPFPESIVALPPPRED